ncbi:MAG: FAD-binding protein [Bifidobacteriaceae bacterium]|jgi:electron transfer flavoprotein alpha subunit|nr:FAD-binding protein [Bifidobacteriaceae bacterium]
MTDLTYVLVADNLAVSRLIDQAGNLDRPVAAVVVGPEDLAAAVAGAGVDRAVWLGTADGRALEAFAPAVAAVVAAAPGVVLAARRPAERVWLGAVAAALAAPLVSGVTRIERRGGQAAVTHEVGGGLAERTVVFDGPVAVMMDGGAPLSEAGEAGAVDRQDAAGVYNIKVHEVARAGTDGADLTAAKLVVAAGRGFKSQADLALAQDLAVAMGAALACSRPLAEGLEWMGKERYVGISGNQLAPDLYLAVGISGQLQHLGGVRGARLIAAVNSDPAAPIMAQADYRLNGDLYELLPALTAALGRSEK